MDELTPRESFRLLTETMVAHIGVVSDGEPYVSPISYVMIDDAIYIRTTPGRRTEAIAANPRICLEISDLDHETGVWRSVIVWGDAEEVDDDGLSEQVVMALLEKYRSIMGSPLNPGDRLAEPDLILRIPIGDMSGRSSGSLFSTRTRPGRL